MFFTLFKSYKWYQIVQHITYGFALCNLTKINTPPWVFFTLFKLYKWYQIVQHITYGFALFVHYRNNRPVSIFPIYPKWSNFTDIFCTNGFELLFNFINLNISFFEYFQIEDFDVSVTIFSLSFLEIYSVALYQTDIRSIKPDSTLV